MIKSQEKKIYKLALALLIVNAYVLSYPYACPDDKLGWGWLMMMAPVGLSGLIFGLVLSIKSYLNDTNTRTIPFIFSLAVNLTMFGCALAAIKTGDTESGKQDSALTILILDGIIGGFQSYVWFQAFKRGE